MRQPLLIAILILAFISIINAQDKKQMGISVQAGMAVPTDDFGDSYNLGFGGSGTFLFFLNNRLALSGTAGYITWKGKIEYLTDASFSVIPILVGARYYLSKAKLLPYVSAQTGMYFSNYSASVDLGYFGKTNIDVSNSDFGIAVGGGINYGIGNNIKLDVNAKYDIIMATGGSKTYFAFFAGFIFLIK